MMNTDQSVDTKCIKIFNTLYMKDHINKIRPSLMFNIFNMLKSFVLRVDKNKTDDSTM